MKRIIIEIDGDFIDVVNEDGERCQGLTIGETLEQILREIGRLPRGYPMKTRKEWAAEERKRRQCANPLKPDVY